jgi:hypothetical protein
MLNVCSLDGGQSRVEIVAKHKPKKKRKKKKKKVRFERMQATLE